jgi:hypothetical protein
MEREKERERKNREAEIHSERQANLGRQYSGRSGVKGVGGISQKSEIPESSLRCLGTC